jgi:hypothetical protein
LGLQLVEKDFLHSAYSDGVSHLTMGSRAL